MSAGKQKDPGFDVSAGKQKDRGFDVSAGKQKDPGSIWFWFFALLESFGSWTLPF